MTKIKVSGLTRPQDAELAVAEGVDMLACVFVASSPRYVTLEQAWAIRRLVPATVSLVGIFVDTPPPLVMRVLDSCQLDAAQLFGREPKADVDALQPRAFKGIVARTAEDVERAFALYLGGRFARVDPQRPGFMVHLTESVGQMWEVISGRAARVPLLVAASGLHAESAHEVIGAARPWGLDVWDAVEASPGIIDASKLRAFVAAVREADRSLAAKAAAAPPDRKRG